MKRMLALALVVAFLPAAALAAEEETVKSRVKAWAASQETSLYGGYSLLYYDDPIFEQVIGRDYQPLVRLGGGWYPVPNLALEYAVGGMYEQAQTVGAISGEGSGEDFEFWVAPVEVGLRYRFKFIDNQFVVPSVFAGYDWWYFREERDSDDVVDGDKRGWHWGADLGILLDPIDPEGAFSMRKDWGVNDTYLCLGYEALEMEADGGLDFSGEIYTVSLRFDLGPAPEK